mmetsp:Transcript_9648/g.17766  ORF Transcript_9648/g.17766 Transcript_9648/m.17766 type:complete len:384 (+) Transcript_9648:356-1507(+)
MVEFQIDDLPPLGEVDAEALENMLEGTFLSSSAASFTDQHLEPLFVQEDQPVKVEMDPSLDTPMGVAPIRRRTGKSKRELMVGETQKHTSKNDPPRGPTEEDLAWFSPPQPFGLTTHRIKQQPPIEVRTRSRNENRVFSCVVEAPFSVDGEVIRAELVFASEPNEVVGGCLGGTLQKMLENGTVSFDDLSVSVASPKHSEKEYALRFAFRNEFVLSTPFYAYSHKSVLKRRRELAVRALSHNSLTQAQVTERLHVIGTPFISSERLQCVLRVSRKECDPRLVEELKANEKQAQLQGPVGVIPDTGDSKDTTHHWLSIRTENLEVFSDSVLFFSIPEILLSNSSDLSAFIQVTNDGRHFSNPLPLHLKSDALPTSKRHCIRSRM